MPGPKFYNLYSNIDGNKLKNKQRLNEVIIDQLILNNSSLLIADMQNAFIHKDGPISLPNAVDICKNIVELINISRKLFIPIIWIKMRLSNWEKGPYRHLQPSRFNNENKGILRQGSFWHDIVDSLKTKMSSEDYIIDKDRYSAFFQTNLDLVLRQNNIQNIIVCGVATNICIESTIRDGFQRDYYPFLIKDCVKAFNNQLQSYSEQIIGQSFGFVINRKELIHILDRKANISSL